MLLSCFVCFIYKYVRNISSLTHTLFLISFMWPNIKWLLKCNPSIFLCIFKDFNFNTVYILAFRSGPFTPKDLSLLSRNSLLCPLPAIWTKLSQQLNTGIDGHQSWMRLYLFTNSIKHVDWFGKLPHTLKYPLQNKELVHCSMTRMKTPLFVFLPSTLPSKFPGDWGDWGVWCRCN